MFLAFNATAHSLVANNLSRRAEGRAAEVLARLAQLAVALSIPVAAALFVGRGLLPDLFTGEGVCEGACEQQEEEAAVVAARPTRRPPAACSNSAAGCAVIAHDQSACHLASNTFCLQRMCWCGTRWRMCCPCCSSSW